MSKFSVKKPFTVFVAVIAILVLGVVAYLKMTPDLLPNMDFPYIMIMTTYPGASPEKVEAEITKPMEQSMATLEHIKQVSSTSSENYSMVMLEFEEAVNMDTVGVDIQQNISALSAQWDDMVGTPYVLKINPSMLPVAVAAVSMEDMDTVALTEFLDETLMNKLEGIPGVARISTSGAVSQQLHVVLDQNKIDALNETITQQVNAKLDEAAQELTDKKEELTTAQKELKQAQNKLDQGKNELADKTAAGEAELNHQQTQLLSTKAQLQDQITQLQAGKTQIQSTLSILKTLQSALKELQGQIGGMGEDLETLLGLQGSLDSLMKRWEELQKQIEDLENNQDMTQEEIDAAIGEIMGSQEYQQLQAQIDLIKAQLAAMGVDPDSLAQEIQKRQEALESLQKQLEELEKALGDQGLTAQSLDEQIRELEGNLAQIDQGVAALEKALKELDSGMLQLQDAAKLLSQQKTAGLIQMGSAAAELAVGKATITNALTQIDAGFDTIEDSRQEALDKADLENIITMEMLSGLLTAQNFSMPAGYVEQDGVSYMVSVGQEITDQKTLEGLLLFDMGMEGVEPVYLRDVAAVLLTDNRDETYAKLDGEDSIVLSFEKQSTYATAETTDNILDRFRELEKEYPGLRFVSLMNQGDYIYMIVQSILKSLFLGALFSVLVLWLFLKDLRPTFITLCSIPISVIFAIVLMYFSGVTINMISLSGLAVAVGMLVDNSVVVIENIYRLRAKGANVIQAAVSGARQVAGAVIASTLTTVCVFLPIVFVEGITRQLFTDLALTMSYALLASLIVALTLVPAMASGLLRKEKKTQQKLMDQLLSGYEKLAGWALDHKAIVLIGAALLLVLTGALSIARGFIFMPEMDMSSLTVNITMPEDTDMETAVSLADQVLDRMGTLEEIGTAGAMMSSGGLLGGASDSHDVTVYVTLKDENGSGAAVAKKIEALCADLPCTVSGSSAMMDMSMLTGSGLVLNIYADDMEALQKAAAEAARVLETVEGVAQVSDGLEDTAPALQIQVDRNKAMAKGITVAQIYMELAQALTNSQTAMTLELDGTTTDVIIEKPEGAVLQAEDLEDYAFEVTGQDGTVKSFTLGEVAQIRHTTSLNSISRAAQRRYLTVSGELEEGYNVTKVTAKAEQAMKALDLGQGVTYTFAGENETIMEAVEQLFLMLLLGVVLVYLVMVAQFQSLKSPFIVMFTIPLAFTGGFMALLICGMEVSVVSLIGFIMLVGIIVNNGIVLVDYINQLRIEGASRREAILEAGKTRMRPILMTTVTTILGLLDMALSRNMGTTLMQPVAVVCIGGLTYATLMTLFVVPCIYDSFNKKELRTVREEDLKLLDI